MLCRFFIIYTKQSLNLYEMLFPTCNNMLHPLILSGFSSKLDRMKLIGITICMPSLVSIAQKLREFPYKCVKECWCVKDYYITVGYKNQLAPLLSPIARFLSPPNFPTHFLVPRSHTVLIIWSEWYVPSTLAPVS
jgi:hypothetical protein